MNSITECCCSSGEQGYVEWLGNRDGTTAFRIVYPRTDEHLGMSWEVQVRDWEDLK